jgi:plasmid stabilization system protein ParE
MGYTVVWTKQAEKGYSKIIRFLIENWTEKEIQRFLDETRTFISLVEENPMLLKKSASHKHLHRGPLNRLTIVTYRVRPHLKRIELVNIRGARQKPAK